MYRVHRVSTPSSIYSPTRTLFNSVQKPQLGAIRLQSGFGGCTELSAFTLIPIENPNSVQWRIKSGGQSHRVGPLHRVFPLSRRGYMSQAMIRNPHPNRELDRDLIGALMMFR